MKLLILKPIYIKFEIIEKKAIVTKNCLLIKYVCQRLYYFDFYSSPEHLKTHVRRIHEGIKNHKCAQCDKAFFQYGELKKHVKDIHDGIREFKCEQCGKAFRDD